MTRDLQEESVGAVWGASFPWVRCGWKALVSQSWL